MLLHRCLPWCSFTGHPYITTSCTWCRIELTLEVFHFKPECQVFFTKVGPKKITEEWTNRRFVKYILETVSVALLVIATRFCVPIGSLSNIGLGLWGVSGFRNTSILLPFQRGPLVLRDVCCWRIRRIMASRSSLPTGYATTFICDPVYSFWCATEFTLLLKREYNVNKGN